MRSPTSSSEPNRSMSSSSSFFAAGLEAEVVSATPGGPYWPRGFFTPGRLMQHITSDIYVVQVTASETLSSPALLEGLDVVVPAEGMDQIRWGRWWDRIKHNRVSLRWDVPETRKHIKCHYTNAINHKRPLHRIPRNYPSFTHAITLLQPRFDNTAPTGDLFFALLHERSREWSHRWKRGTRSHSHTLVWPNHLQRRDWNDDRRPSDDSSCMGTLENRHG